jgi:holo-[acyl-carrier protein] synthase
VSALAPAMPARSRARLAEGLRSATVDSVVRRSTGDRGGTAGDGSAPPGLLRVGVDLVPVADVAESVARLGRRYLYRVFTPHERACARLDALPPPPGPHGPPADGGAAGPGYSMESLAARFAAKEAAVKVLRPVGARPEWRSIEVRRVDGGWCELRLTGLAAGLAELAGITTLAVSVTHEPMVAAACVVGMRRGDAPARRRPPPPDRRGK